MAKKRSGAHRRVSAQPWASARWTPEDAQRVLAAWHGSGLDLSAWCRREGVEYERVRRWRSRLAVRSRRTATSPTARFLPVRVLGNDPSPEGPSFELELSRGVRLRVPPQFDEASLARLLRVVEAGA
ncbi:MAG: IS66 family insertion sequence element accessory protein TnpA [Gammaproteobacteria bacterium]